MKVSDVQYLHIVAFDVPYPADYGGVIDIYHKVRSLHRQGVKVILHCYQYGRPESPQLKKICHKVYYYRRRTFKNPFYGKTPYIVNTRSASDLLRNLKKDQYPILFEGLHTTYFLNDESLAGRVKLVRNHNIEYDYYKNLEEVEDNFFKKYFFRVEAERLKSYEKILKQAQAVLAISPKDHEVLQKRYHNSVYVSAFHPNDTVKSEAGRGEFLFYHGNLGVGENNYAALFLVNEVFCHLSYPVIIAGSNPSAQLRTACQQYKHITLCDNWSNEDILEHIKQAHINVLPTFQATGIKLKLLNALYLGRHCLVNTPMVAGTGLETMCVVRDKAEDMVKAIRELWQKPFTKEQVQLRKGLTKGDFDNTHNAGKILHLLQTLKTEPLKVKKEHISRKPASMALTLATLLTVIR